ncbi:MAG: FG-GAP repeat protein [Candidatus Midichloria sp.]|nr:FG-GAP repeat protein [Candidatus Midichloria sp.]
MGSFKPVIFSSLSCSSADCSVADFNGDGKPDLATANHYSNSITCFIKYPPPFQQPLQPSTTESTTTTSTTTTEPTTSTTTTATNYYANHYFISLPSIRSKILCLWHIINVAVKVIVMVNIGLSMKMWC